MAPPDNSSIEEKQGWHNTLGDSARARSLLAEHKAAVAAVEADLALKAEEAAIGQRVSRVARCRAELSGLATTTYTTQEAPSFKSMVNSLAAVVAMEGASLELVTRELMAKSCSTPDVLYLAEEIEKMAEQGSKLTIEDIVALPKGSGKLAEEDAGKKAQLQAKSDERQRIAAQQLAEWKGLVATVAEEQRQVMARRVAPALVEKKLAARRQAEAGSTS